MSFVFSNKEMLKLKKENAGRHKSKEKKRSSYLPRRPLSAKRGKRIPQVMFVDGLRVTDKETMKIVEMVLSGSINKEYLDESIGEFPRLDERKSMSKYRFVQFPGVLP